MERNVFTETIKSEDQWAQVEKLKKENRSLKTTVRALNGIVLMFDDTHKHYVEKNNSMRKKMRAVRKSLKSAVLFCFLSCAYIMCQVILMTSLVDKGAIEIIPSLLMIIPSLVLLLFGIRVLERIEDAENDIK